MASRTQSNGCGTTRCQYKQQEGTTTQRSSTSPFAWRRRHSHGSNNWTKTPFIHGRISRWHSPTTTQEQCRILETGSTCLKLNNKKTRLYGVTYVVFSTRKPESWTSRNAIL